MNANITPPNDEKFCYKVPFRVSGNLALITALSQNGVIVRVDRTFRYACACFDNTIDYNKFKQVLLKLPGA